MSLLTFFFSKITQAMFSLNQIKAPTCNFLHIFIKTITGIYFRFSHLIPEIILAKSINLTICAYIPSFNTSICILVD